MKLNKVLISILLVAIVVAMAAFLWPYLGVSKVQDNNRAEQLKKDISLFIAGDVMFDRGIRFYAAQNGGNDFIFQKVSDFLKQHDLNMVNLEGPITDNQSLSSGSKVGSANNYVFTFDPSWAKTLAQHNISLVGIANNHILNFEEKGVQSTTKYLSEAGVDYFGEPNGKRSAIKEIRGVKIGFVAYNEFLLADYNQEKNEAVAEIKKVKKEADIVIVFCHWGIEYQKTATPAQQQFAREFIDAGADAVIGSHPHVIEPMEEYKGKRIYYSLGNFIFDQYFDENVRKGMGVIITINPATKELQFEEKHFYLDKNGQTSLLAD